MLLGGLISFLHKLAFYLYMFIKVLNYIIWIQWQCIDGVNTVLHIPVKKINFTCNSNYYIPTSYYIILGGCLCGLRG